MSLPPAIKGKITELLNAAHEEAFKGMQEPAYADELEEYLETARYNLETTIETYLKREAGQALKEELFSVTAHLLAAASAYERYASSDPFYTTRLRDFTTSAEQAQTKLKELFQ